MQRLAPTSMKEREVGFGRPPVSGMRASRYVPPTRPASCCPAGTSGATDARPGARRDSQVLVVRHTRRREKESPARPAPHTVRTIEDAASGLGRRFRVRRRIVAVMVVMTVTVAMTVTTVMTVMVVMAAQVWNVSRTTCVMTASSRPGPDRTGTGGSAAQGRNRRRSERIHPMVLMALMVLGTACRGSRREGRDRPPDHAQQDRQAGAPGPGRTRPQGRQHRSLLPSAAAFDTPRPAPAIRCRRRPRSRWHCRPSSSPRHSPGPGRPQEE